MKEFSSIKERIEYYSSLKFADAKPLPPPEKQRFKIKDDARVNAIRQEINDVIKSTKPTMSTIPYFSNNVSGVTVFKEPKNVTNTSTAITLTEIIVGLISAKTGVTVYQFLEQTDLTTILLKMDYPMKKLGDNASEMYFTSSVEYNDDFITITINDPILYALVLDYSKHVITTSTSTTLYILGKDLPDEDEIITSKEFDAYFISMAKAIFVSTLLARNIDALGLSDFPSYGFSLGTYHVDETLFPEFSIIHASNNLVHVLPLWSNVFLASFTVRTAETDFKFSYQLDTFFKHYEQTIATECFPSISDRTRSVTPLNIRLTLNKTDDCFSTMDVYNANLNLRNKLGSQLSGYANYNAVKDKLYTKTPGGAKNKLQAIFQAYDFSPYETVLDLGTAPGTWLEYLMNMPNFSRIHAVTRNNRNDIKVYPSVLKSIETSHNTQLFYNDSLNYLRETPCTYNLILSDVATKSSYEYQSLEHDELFVTQMQLMVQKLRLNGAIVMKVFDLTEKLYSKIIPLLKKFQRIDVIKPDGSCPTNAEKYIVAIGYNSNYLTHHHHVVLTFNKLLCMQIDHLTNLLTNGFNQTINARLNYNRTKLSINSSDSIPYYLFPMLSSLRFSEQLYPEGVSCTISDEKTLLSDRYLHLKWDIPLTIPDRMVVILETSIGYESHSVALQQPFMMHYGVILEDGIMKHFVLLEKEAAVIISDKFDNIAIVQHPIESFHVNQTTVCELMKQESYLQRFPSIDTFLKFYSHTRQLSLSSLLYYQTNCKVIESSNMVHQFFREAETMHLFYTRQDAVSYAANSRVKTKTETINLQQISNRCSLYKEYQSNLDRGKTSRESFYLLFHKFTIGIGDSELLETSMCTTKRSYIEHSTQQICVSQPSAIHFRRSRYFQCI